MPIPSSTWRSTAAALAIAALPLASQAGAQRAADGTPPGYNAACHCYRGVPYGSATWFEPTTRKIARQVMDIWMPSNGGAPRPIVYYGHPNGTSQFIANDTRPESLWSRLVKPLTDQGFIVVSYEFRHPVVNYVEGQPAPRYDIQKAINAFVLNYAAVLGADPSNSFISGQSRGGGLGLLTALAGRLTGGTRVQALWTNQAQTTFNCEESATDFVLPSDRDAFLAGCVAVPNAGSAMRAVTGVAPPTVVGYDRPFHKELVPASEVDVHYPDFGWKLCRHYASQGNGASCLAVESLAEADAWAGMADYFTAHRQAPL